MACCQVDIAAGYIKTKDNDGKLHNRFNVIDI